VNDEIIKQCDKHESTHDRTFDIQTKWDRRENLISKLQLVLWPDRDFAGHRDLA